MVSRTACYREHGRQCNSLKGEGRRFESARGLKIQSAVSESVCLIAFRRLRDSWLKFAIQKLLPAGQMGCWSLSCSSLHGVPERRQAGLGLSTLVRISR